MTIRGNVGKNPIDILTTDTVLVGNIPERIAISAFSLHNTSGVSVNVQLYISPDATSASGKRVANYTLSANTSVDVVEIIGQGYSSAQNIIAIADLVGTNAGITEVQYTGDV